MRDGVVGFSAYEIYVKQHQSEDPNNPPASEERVVSFYNSYGIFHVT